MKFTYDKLLVEPLAYKTHGAEGILMPEMLHRSENIGRVLSAGSLCEEHGIKKGDLVIYYLERPSDINGRDKFAIYMEKKQYIVMFWNMVSGIVINQEHNLEKMKQSGISSIKIDYSKDVRPVGAKVFVALKPPEDMTESGIHIPYRMPGQFEMYGEILALGPLANKNNYDKSELQVGDIVNIGKMTSGGDMGTNIDGRRVWKCHGNEVQMKYRGGEWFPVGPRVIIEPHYGNMEKRKEQMPHPMFDGLMQEIDVWVDVNNPKIVIPANQEIVNLTSRIVKTGSGCDSDSSMAQTYGIGGACVFDPGDLVLHVRLYSTTGQEKQPASGVFPLQGDKERFLCFLYHLDAKIDEGENIEMRSTKGEEMDLSLGDFGM